MRHANTIRSAGNAVESYRAKSSVDKDPRLASKFKSDRLCFMALCSLAVSGMIYYAYRFCLGLSSLWFNPNMTTDDAMQQSYVFHKINHPEIFKGDLITQAMESYLAPAHYAISYAATWLSGSPIMGGHWVMAIQLGVALLSIFFAAYRLGGLIPACFSATWLLHSRHIVQRLTGGLPRGWAAPIICATICFALYGNHYAVLVVLLIGCLSNPPGTMIAALFYGLVLVWRSLLGEEVSKTKSRKNLLQYIALSPLYIAITWSVTRPPEFIGTMASYKEAVANPAFSRFGGRFPFIPLLDSWSEIRSEGFFAFISQFERIPAAQIEQIPTLVLGLCCLLVIGAVIVRRRIIRSEMLLYLLAVMGVYFASRQVPFYLYVPDRHLRLPLGFFFICVLPAALWNLGTGKFNFRELTFTGAKRVKARLCLGTALMLILAAVIYHGSGVGLRGHLNFNTPANRKGTLFTWLNENTAPDALIAGHPSHIDDTMLFAIRRAYITAETAHPFFDVYYKEVERRLRITWSAYYARDLEEFHQLLSKEGIDYFVFRRNDFRRHTLVKATYFQPFTAWVKELASHSPEQYVLAKFPQPPPNTSTEILPFRDRHSIVVNISALGKYLEKERTLGTSQSATGQVAVNLDRQRTG